MEEIRQLLFLRLSQETSVPPRLALQLLEQFGPDWSGLSIDTLVELGVSRPAATRLTLPTGLQDATLLLRQCEELGIGIMTIEEDAYPQALRHCEDAPLVLYWRGQPPRLKERNLAVVGTRRATAYGRKLTSQILEELAALQPLIISGMAYGIDICAHRKALDLGLTTWGILAQGLDRVYPGAHREFAYKILESGGTLLSEFPPGVPSRAFHFPRRNRIVAGLSDAVLVIESGPEGGSLITAGIAASYNREVFALPGPVDRGQSAGCHSLIREHGAALVTGGRDLALAMNWIPEAKSRRKTGTQAMVESIQTLLPPSLEDMKDVLLWLAREGPQHVEQVQQRTRWSPAFLATRILAAELSGWILTRPGGYLESAFREGKMIF